MCCGRFSGPPIAFGSSAHVMSISNVTQFAILVLGLKQRLQFRDFALRMDNDRVTLLCVGHV